MKGVSIEIADLSVSYGGTQVLTGIDLSIAPGEFIALLGPSGCGKTTLLRTLAGFVPAAAGEVRVDGQDVTGLPPEKRGMAMMFQSYALWPHMTVAENISFPLRIRRQPKAMVTAQVQRMLTLVGLDGFADRNVTRLSGGQRQRVALARALAVDPPVLLLDEPLSNLDARIRLSMRHEVKSLQKQLGLTAILVTHDREEAMAMADRVVILDHGTVAQAGTPEEIYHRPVSPYVAAFMGAENTCAVSLRHEGDRIALSGQQIRGTADLPVRAVNSRVRQDGPAAVFFRGDAARIAVPGETGSGDRDGHLTLSGRVSLHSYLGNVYRHTVDIGGSPFLVDHPVRMDVGVAVDVCVPAAALHIFERTGSAAATPAGEQFAQTH
ncbi:ABC transporter ATP-binding protein [Novispirillum itersonii]|nr:ABC transporter ATP-binding protein [Novispirillum itersonii]